MIQTGLAMRPLALIIRKPSNDWPLLALTISNSSIAFNRGPDGAFSGAVYSYAIGDKLTLESTIVAENYAGDVDSASGVTIDGAKNLSTNSLVTMPDGMLTICPQLEPLASNGGPTSTLAIKHTSPAINVGNKLLGLGDRSARQRVTAQLQLCRHRSVRVARRTGRRCVPRRIQPVPGCLRLSMKLRAEA